MFESTKSGFSIGLISLLLTACSAEPMPEAKAASHAGNVVVSKDFFLFKASDQQQSMPRCMIFYPGGLVDPIAYAPYLQQLANAGYNAYLLKLTMNLAVLDADAADDAKADAFALENCESFLVAGHSLGGTMAVDYVQQYPADALLLLAAYPRSATNIASHPSPVVSISASQDQLTTADEITATRPQLPQATRFIEIKGGNHAFFGYYGPQNRDGEASISRQEQQEELLEATLLLLAH